MASTTSTTTDVSTTSCEECRSLQQQMGVSNEEMTQPKTRKLTKTGKVLLSIFGASFVGLSAVCVPFLMPALRKVCLPYVPATNRQVSNVMSLLKGRKGDVIDLGSGDGRIVIEAAKRGFVATGVELNPWLVLYSKLQARRNGVHKLTDFKTTDLWKYDLSKHENIVIFGVEQMMDKLESKITQELHSEGQVIACRFPFKNVNPSQTVDNGIDTVWCYEKGQFEKIS